MLNDDEKLRKIIKEEVGTNLNDMAESLRNLRPKPKKINYTEIILYLVLGTASLYMLYQLSKLFE